MLLKFTLDWITNRFMEQNWHRDIMKKKKKKKAKGEKKNQ